MIRGVKNVAEKHKNDTKFTGQTVITDMCNDIIPKLEKLSAYETAEEEGRLVVLPCKVGRTVYCILYTLAFGEIGDKAEKHYFITETKFEYGMIDDLNETVFLTREEAEKALEEIKSKQWLNV